MCTARVDCRSCSCWPRRKGPSVFVGRVDVSLVFVGRAVRGGPTKGEPRRIKSEYFPRSMNAERDEVCAQQEARTAFPLHFLLSASCGWPSSCQQKFEGNPSCQDGGHQLMPKKKSACVLAYQLLSFLVLVFAARPSSAASHNKPGPSALIAQTGLL